MAKGTSIHAALEHYLRTGEVLIEHTNEDAPGVAWPTMEFVQAAKDCLPRPLSMTAWWEAFSGGAKNVGLLIEQPFEIDTWEDGPTILMRLDLVEAYPTLCTITDHKTLSDARYAKGPQELAENVQLILNAKAVFENSDYEVITLRHLYLLTRGKRPKAWSVKVNVDRAHVEAEFKKILVTVKEMALYSDLAPPTAEPLPPNTDHCGAYGGCPHKTLCFGGVSDLIPLSKGPRKMSALSDLLKGAGGTRDVAKEMAASVPLPGLTPPVSIVPPDAPRNDEPNDPTDAKQAHAPEELGIPRRKRRTKAEMEAARATESDPTSPESAPNSPPESLSSRFPAQARESMEIPVIAPVDFSVPPPASNPLTTPDPTCLCGVEALFIDCLPGKGWPGEPPTDALYYMAAMNKLASSAGGVQDWRLIKYGEGKGHLSNAVKAMMPGFDKALFVDSRMPGADVILEVVVPYAKVVFRGMR